MASAWVCDNGDGMPAVTQVINVGNGDSEVYCGQCWVTFVLALADAIREANPEPAPAAAPEPATAPAAGADLGEPLPFTGGPDDDEDDDDDETAPYLSPVEAMAQPSDVEPEVLASPKRARKSGGRRAPVRGVS